MSQHLVVRLTRSLGFRRAADSLTARVVVSDRVLLSSMFAEIWLSCLLKRSAKQTEIPVCILRKAIAVSHAVWDGVAWRPACGRRVMWPCGPLDARVRHWLRGCCWRGSAGVAPAPCDVNHAVPARVRSAGTNSNAGWDGLFFCISVFLPLSRHDSQCFSSQSQDSSGCLFFCARLQGVTLFFRRL